MIVPLEKLHPLLSGKKVSAIVTVTNFADEISFADESCLPPEVSEFVFDRIDGGEYSGVLSVVVRDDGTVIATLIRAMTAPGAHNAEASQ